MVLEKAAGMRLLLLKYCNWTLNVVGFQLYYYSSIVFFSCSSFVVKWIFITWRPFNWLWIQRDISGGFCVRIIKIDFGWGKGKLSLKANKIFKNHISWVVHVINDQTVPIFGYDEFFSYCIIIVDVHIAQYLQQLFLFYANLK